MPEPESSFIIFDHTVLSIFAVFMVMDILDHLYKGRAFISQVVWNAIKAEGDVSVQDSLEHSRIIFQAVNQALSEGWLQVPNKNVKPGEKVTELPLVLEFCQYFGRGMSESMALAYCCNWVLASDDLKAKEFAKTKGILVTGTLGIISKARSLKIIDSDEANEISRHLFEKGYCFPTRAG